jgi:PAS domain S-box-containing protein
MKIKKVKDWGFFYKIFALNLVGVTALILLIVFQILPTMKHHIFEEKGIAVKNLVDVGYKLVKYYENKAENFELTTEEAQKEAIKELSDLKYGDGDYFWINDLSGNMVMHGAKPELNGKYMNDFQDPNGKYIFKDFVNTAKQFGAGYVNYDWPKPGYDKPVPKISYVKLFDKWGWVIGTGIYVNDVNEEYASISRSIFIILVIFVGAIIFFTYYFAKAMIRPINNLTEASEKIIKGDANVKVVVETEDEIGKLANTFNNMAEKISLQIQYLDYLPAPIMVIDKDFNIQYMNKKGAEIVAKDQKQLVGQKCYDNFKTGHCKTEICALYKAMKNNRVFTEETIARPDGKELPILYTGAPVKNREGVIIGALESITDIREIKEMQNYLTRSTRKMMLAMEQFADGNLAINVVPEKRNDDLGKLFSEFNRAVQNIKIMIEQVQDSIKATASSSTEISSTAEEIAAGAQEQSMQTSEISTAVEQMTKTILETSKNASTASENSQKAGAIAKQGGKVVEDTVKGIESIADVVMRASITVKKLGKSSNQIGEIIQVIDDIADQTNLLALNAAIEAARAGEMGRGFAVVADEVRKLAERTTKATKEIAAMIKEIQKDTVDAVDSIEKGTLEVQKGKELAGKAGESLKEIINASTKVVGDVNQVACASEEQSATAEQISKNIEAISNITHESASGTQQMARAAEDLNKLTENLEILIRKFKIEANEEEYYEENVLI